MAKTCSAKSIAFCQTGISSNELYTGHFQLNLSLNLLQP
jgi:hypothetical protein